MRSLRSRASHSVPARFERARATACAFVVAAALLICPGLPTTAWASVLPTDTIAGSSVAERSLSATLCPSIEAEHAILVDEQGNAVFERSATEPANIASITKVMTAVVALELAPLDTTITVTADAAAVGESTAGLKAGDVLTLDNALKALMIPSGNDAAVAIAESLGKSVLGAATDEEANRAFVAKMNEKAAELGCADSVFENAHGLDTEQFAGNLHSTATDVVKIVTYAMQNDYFRTIVDIRTERVPLVRDGVDSSVELYTTDLLLGSYEGSCGVKTGNTDLAGPCFAGACNRGEGDIYAIVLHSTSEAQRFTDTTTLFDWYYGNCIDYQLAHSETVLSADIGGVREVPVVAQVALAAWPDKTVPATFADPQAAVEVFALDGNVSQSFEFFEVGGSVEVGDVVGRATFWQRNEQIAQQDIVACEAVAAPDLVQAAQIGWDRFVALFTGAATVADSVVLNETPLLIER